MEINGMDEFPTDKIGIGMTPMPYGRFMVFFTERMRDGFEKVVAAVEEVGVLENVRVDEFDLSIRFGIKGDYQQFSLTAAEVVFPIVSSIVHDIYGCDECNECAGNPVDTDDKEEGDEREMDPEMAAWVDLILDDVLGPDAEGKLL